MAKILIVSMAPIFPDIVHGGSQKVLVELTTYLGKKGHAVTILCSYRAELEDPFFLTKNVLVKPILRFKQPFPNPYHTPITYVTRALNDIYNEHLNCDIVYIHDGSIYAHDIFSQKPLIISIRDMFYSESIIGFYSFKRDCLILNSLYAFNTALALIAPFCNKLKSRIEVVPNGVDTTVFTNYNKLKSRKMFGINSDNVILLFPHRTVPEKGISFLIRVIQELERKGTAKLSILITEWIDTNYDKTLKNKKNNIKKLFSDHGVISNIYILPWQAQKNMPYLYSAADVTVCLGNAPELFGSNVVLESLSCGTCITIIIPADERQLKLPMI